MLTRIIHKFVKGKEATKRPGQGLSIGENAPDPSRPRESFASADWKPGDVLDNRYRIEEVMYGSMGKVFMAEHLGWKIKMAIKSPRPEVLADKEGMRCILNEANSWIKMGMHPNIAVCYYVLSLGNVPHLFIEYVDGGSLAEWIRAGRCRDLRTALSLAIQFCHGMEYTHSRNMIHRDIKPQNILITKNTLLKITDFGIALNIGECPGEGGKGKEGEDAVTAGFRGTPGYASPEQFRNAHAVDKRSDIFSFGICLWLMLCGKKPFAKNHARQPIPEPTPLQTPVQFTPVLAGLLKKCVAFSPEERFQGFTELRTALNEAYKEAFQISCPYFELGNIDLRADSLNNRAVSLFELGRDREAAAALGQALEMNDMLPEAVYNHILMRWKSGKVRRDRLLRQIEAARKTLAVTPLFKDLEDRVASASDKKGDSGRHEKELMPEYRLCVARKTLEIYREEQMHAAIHSNMLDHLSGKRYKACHDVMLKAWKSRHYRRDQTFYQAYEELLLRGRPAGIEGCQRLTTLKGCGAPVRNMVLIPGTQKIVTAGPGGEILLHDISAPRDIKVIGKKEGSATSLAVSPGGDLLVSGGADGTITLWSIKTRTEAGMPSHESEVTVLAFDRKGKTLAAGGADGIIHLYSLPSMTKTILAGEGSGAVRSILFYNKDRNIATGSDDGAIRLWERGEKEFTRLLNAHALPVKTLSRAPDSMSLASCSADRYVRLWNLSSGMLKREIKAHEEAVSSVLFLPDGRHIVTGCEDDIIKAWEIETGKCLLTLQNRGDGLSTLAPGPRDHMFLSGGENGTMVLWLVIHLLKFDGE